MDIVKLYKSGLTTREVADKLGCSKSKVAVIVKKAGISRSRNIRASVLKKRAKKCIAFTQEQINYMDGLLISDGCYPRPLSKITQTTLYSQTSICKDWLEHVRNSFKENGIKSKVIREKRRKGKCYYLFTHRYDQFYQQYNRWYKGTVKRVPRDIKIGDVNLLRNWVYGDGTRVRSSFRFCTDSFCIEDIDFLIKKLKKETGFKFKKVFFGKTKNNKEKYRISLNKKNGLEDFFRYIGEPEIKYFLYKWGNE